MSNDRSDLSMRFPSDPAEIAAARSAVELRCAAAGFDEKSCGEIGLCVNEALANIIRHAYAERSDRPIELRLHIENDRHGDAVVVITLRDWGNGIDPTTLPTPAKALNPLLPGGLGMICLRELMDSTVFEPQPDGMLLTLKRRRSRAAPTTRPTREPARRLNEKFMEELNPGTAMITSPRKEGETLFAAINGEVDLHNSPELREGLIELLLQAQPRILVLDLAQVAYMDSSAIAVLVEMLQKLRKIKGEIRLEHLQPRVKSLLEIARLDSIFKLS